MGNFYSFHEIRFALESKAANLFDRKLAAQSTFQLFTRNFQIFLLQLEMNVHRTTAHNFTSSFIVVHHMPEKSNN